MDRLGKEGVTDRLRKESSKDIDRTHQGGTRPSLFHLSKRSEKDFLLRPERWNNDRPSDPAV